MYIGDMTLLTDALETAHQRIEELQRKLDQEERVSESRRKMLFEKSEALAEEWRRAERAVALADSLQKRIDLLEDKVRPNTPAEHLMSTYERVQLRKAEALALQLEEKDKLFLEVTNRLKARNASLKEAIGALLEEDRLASESYSPLLSQLQRHKLRAALYEPSPKSLDT